MIPLVSQLLNSGYTASNILNFLSKKIPQLAGNIQGAQKSGYPPETILKYLSTNLKTDEAGEKVLSAGDAYLKGVGIKTSQERSQSRNKFLKGALGVAGGVLGLYHGLNQAKNFLSAAPTVGQVPTPPTGPQAPPLPIKPTPNPMPPIGPNMGANTPQPPQPVNPTVPPPSPPSAPMPQQPQGQGAPPQMPKAADILEQFGLRQTAEKLRAQGKSPEIISAVLSKSLKGEERARFGELLKSGQAPPFQELIKQFMSEPPTMQYAELPPEKQRNFGGLLEPVKPKEIVPEEYQEPERKPIEKGSLVLTPDGKIGDVKDRTKNGMLVEEGGKAKDIPEDELEQEPEDVISITQNLLKIPEVDRSSVVSLFTYDPSDKDMFIQYHNGETYRYKDVDPEKVLNVANKMGIPITEGQNIFGAWSPEDKKSIGATLIQEFLKDPKYAKPKKGEAANPNYRKLETFYDYWEKLRRKSKKKKI